MDVLLGNDCCTHTSCGKPAVMSLGQQEFCLDHFLTQCYERLDSLETLVRGQQLDPNRVPRLRTLLEECSTRTLLVCLRHQSLTNLDRSRLLEVLLQCGELQLVLRNRTSLSASTTERPFMLLKDLPQFCRTKPAKATPSRID